MIEPQRIKDGEWITIAEAAHIAGDNESYIRELVQTGKVKTRQRRQTVLVNRRALLNVQRQLANTALDFYPSQIALTTIEQRSELEQQKRNQAAIRLLTDWTNATDEEAAEQTDTLSYLVEHLDEDHANRQIFPDQLKQQLRHLLATNE